MSDRGVRDGKPNPGTSSHNDEQPKSAPAPKRTCLLVLGMHRSGTSALTRVLSIAGARLPAHLIGAAEGNEIGHWEPTRLVAYHDELLHKLGSKWDDWRALQLDTLPIKRRTEIKAEIVGMLAAEYGNATLFVLKDPRICRFAPLFLEALEETGIDVRNVVAFRNPLEVAASLETRTTFWKPENSRVDSSLMWLRHVLDAEAATRDKRRALISYNSLLVNWKASLASLTKKLGVTWPHTTRDIAEQVEAFLAPAQRHHARSTEDVLLDPMMRDWIGEAYESLLVLECNPNSETAGATLDRIRTEFDHAVPVIERLGLEVRRSFDARARDLKTALEAREAEAAHLHQLLSVREAALNDAASKAATFAIRLGKIEVEAALQQQTLVAREAAIVDTNSKTEGLAKKLAETEAQAAEQKQALVASEAARVDAARKIEGLEKQLANAEAQAAEQRQVLTAREAALHDAISKSEEFAKHFAETDVEKAALMSRCIDQTEEIVSLRAQKDLKALQLSEVHASTSWRLSYPIRATKLAMRKIADMPSRVRGVLSIMARKMWYSLPVSQRLKQPVKSALFRLFPFIFHRTAAYRAWQYSNAPARSASTARLGSLQQEQKSAAAFGRVSENDEGPDRIAHYVPILDAAPLTDRAAQVIAFYLPQFHPIPENDAWWGKGFTEWTNVTAARPQFIGHYQPRRPGELGYYDLRVPEVQRRQVELAKLYGIGAFCFHYYWFAGRTLLELPTERYRQNQELDFPYCLCWANENWTRRWDGLEHDVLMAQKHSPEDDIAFISHVSKYLSDPRYVRIGGRPMLIVYRPNLLPNARETAARWRQWCRTNGVGEIYLAYTQSFECVDPSLYGFDAAIEFPPNNIATPILDAKELAGSEGFDGILRDWRTLALGSENYVVPPYRLFRGVCPSWDNTARRKNKGTVFVGNTPALFQEWLGNALAETRKRFEDPDERLVFVNAWNEWAEGAYLEPDEECGYAYLDAVRSALTAHSEGSRPSILLVTHDCHPHGAQYLALSIVKGLRDLGHAVYVWAIGAGLLVDEFRKSATHFHQGPCDGTAQDFLAFVKERGVTRAIANTTVSGAALPVLKASGFKVLSLVHEMPGVIRDMGLEKSAQSLAEHAHRIVFPAQIVADGFASIAKVDSAAMVIRHQGLLRPNPFKNRREEALAEIQARHGLDPNTRMVLNVAYVDRRKAPDLFVRMAAEVLRRHPDTVFFWVGHEHPQTLAEAKALAEQLGVSEQVRFLSFIREPMAYYAAASVYALTSREDPFPNVVLESLEVGVPIVAFTGATGAADLIVEYGGRLAHSGDASDYARCVSELLERDQPLAVTPSNSLRRYLLDLLHYLDGTPRVSVIVPNYNYAHLIVDRLKSVLAQSWPIYEFIVLDDASSDHSVAVIRDELARHQDVAPEFIVNAKNSGSVFRQWQAGLARATGDLVWIAEADDLCSPDFLKTLVTAFHDPSMVLAFCQSKQIDETGKVLAESYLGYTEDVSDDWTHDYIRDGKQEIAWSLAVKNTIPNVSAALFRRDTLERAFATLGDTVYDCRVAGDWLVYMHVLLRGRICFRSSALNLHRRHSSSVTTKEKQEHHFEEIIRAQETARSLVTVQGATVAKAAAYLVKVRRHLGLLDSYEPSRGAIARKSIAIGSALKAGE